MTIKKLTVGIGAALGAMAFLAALIANAAEPSTCTFPAAPESFQSVGPQSKYEYTSHNRILCVLNRLIERSLTGGYLERSCQDISIPAATRQLAVFGLGGTVATNDPVIAPDPIDPTNPARVIADGVQQVDGTVVTAWYFNRDTVNARTVHACVYVRRS